MPDAPITLLDYGIAGALVLETVVFLYFWLKRDREHNRTIDNIDSKNIASSEKLVEQYESLVNKYEGTSRDTIAILTKVESSLDNIKDAISRR